jgi:predicted GNAT family acetyltransferase
MIDDDVHTRADPDLVRLTQTDVPEMLELISRTTPGPFAARTIDMGDYFGIRDQGQLVAMAGERFRPPGYTEISAVCTTPQFRGRGLATRLVLAVAHGIRQRGATPFLHVASTNAAAIKLYESLGFKPRRVIEVESVQPPSPKRADRSRSLRSSDPGVGP